ncbi:NAD-dependent epimerase/dehydratase family protein [Parasphaerochaeta coccoides]|uniref:NAD-dependent epimerase/dehydratase n=1 Tax=Parasphaerochaeta coccoides (strain ATCC BAA-1237 / DSM 17374 / SPN1) TaxID=760011 RepID=F4GJJ6_PARC1|nr:NAD(P)-dependent oxidoreductase [Parasphaerochaeta coccoides]AEC02261.1 NAD-dependent epimerase/dehydratase [Parasphaerochaeta coccoides DSM 17374]
MSKYFVTGVSGCIGGWVAKNLVEAGHVVFALLRNPDKLRKLSLIMKPEDIAKIKVIEGDITDLDLLKRVLQESKAQKIIHLAAMQMPFCKKDPALGARVNVEGTVNVFEAAQAVGLKQVVYSSSTAVYGDISDYANGEFDHNSPLIPRSFYGVYKQANEWQAKVYWQDLGISSIGIRPFVVYGPLRDQGMTSTPTAAIKAAVKGETYEISYGGECEFQFADDVAKIFVAAADAEFTGAEVYNAGGGTVDMKRIVDAIGAAIPESKGKITFKDISLPFPRHKDTGAIEKAIGSLTWTSLEEGIRLSAGYYRNAIVRGEQI